MSSSYPQQDDRDIVAHAIAEALAGNRQDESQEAVEICPEPVDLSNQSQPVWYTRKTERMNKESSRENTRFKEPRWPPPPRHRLTTLIWPGRAESFTVSSSFVPINTNQPPNMFWLTTIIDKEKNNNRPDALS